MRRLLTLKSVLLLAMVSAVVLTGCSSTGETRPDGRFVAGSINVDGKTHRYQVFLPSTAAGGNRPAVILFLHGSGERGGDNHKQAEAGIGPYVRAHADTFPAIVVFPQAAEGSEWNQQNDVVMAELDQVIKTYNADPDRIYLTGLSMGGYGVWDYALRAPDRFAALVPICGGLIAPDRPQMAVTGAANWPDPYATVAGKLHTLPIWIFHGAKDDVLPADYSRKMIAALKTANASDAHYTEFPNANHNSWDPAYQDTPELWTWLFAQKRSAAVKR